MCQISLPLLPTYDFHVCSPLLHQLKCFPQNSRWILHYFLIFCLAVLKMCYIKIQMLTWFCFKFYNLTIQKIISWQVLIKLTLFFPSCLFSFWTFKNKILIKLLWIFYLLNISFKLIEFIFLLIFKLSYIISMQYYAKLWNY